MSKKKQINFDGEDEAKASKGDYGNALKNNEALSDSVEINHGGMEVIRIEKVKEFIRLLKEEIININKKLDLHNVDECECCEKNWKSIYESLEIIDKLAGEKLK